MGMLVGGVGGVNLAAAVGRQAALHGSGDVHSSEGLQRLLLSGSLYPSGRVTEGTVYSQYESPPSHTFASLMATW